MFKDSADYRALKAQAWSVARIKELTMRRISDAEEMPHHSAAKKRFAGKLIIITLCVAAVIAVTVIAAETRVFGLIDLIFPSSETIIRDDSNQSDDESTDEIADEPTDDMLEDFTLVGFAGTPEHDAAEEWRTFSASYISAFQTQDPETGEIVWEGEEGEEAEGIPEIYNHYDALTWTMVEKLNEIAEKYELNLFGELFLYDNDDLSLWDAYQANIANGPFIDTSAGSFILFPGYIWECGTFQFEGNFRLSQNDYGDFEHEHGNVSFTFRSSRKGTLDTAIISHIELAELDNERVYISAHDIPVLFVQSTNQSLLIVDTDTSFIAVTVNAGTWRFTGRTVESFADLINFSMLR